MDYFGEKSAEFDSSGRVSPEEMEQLEQILMGLIDPGKKLKIAGTAAKRSGKTLMRIFDELMGRGVKQTDEVFARKPLDMSYITGKNPSAVTMKDVLKGTKKSLNIPAYERESLVLVKRVFSNLSKRKPSEAKNYGEAFPPIPVSLKYKIQDMGIKDKLLPTLIRQQGKAGPGIPSNRATSDIMKVLESIAESLK